MSLVSRETARAIFEAGLAAADPFQLLGARLREVPDRGFSLAGSDVSFPFPGEGGRIRVLGAGKAAFPLARALERHLSGRELSGRVIVKYGHGGDLERVVVEEGGHPLPDEAGRRATDRLLSDLRNGRGEDRIFFLLTGGASALLVCPAPGVSLADKIETTDLLLKSGATIRELNAVRKHLSEVKGGRLLRRMSPARVLGLLVSDVIGDDLSAIGSGPTVADPTTFGQALEILARHGLEDRAPRSVLDRLREGAEGGLEETPKPGDPILETARHVVLASNRLSLEAAREKAVGLGFRVEIFRRDMEGNVHEVARKFASRLASSASGAPGRGPVALLAGGELTLTVRGSGTGGRNQEFALVAAKELQGVSSVLVLSAGTDGTDGPTDAAGAFSDGQTWKRARERGVDPEAALAENDSYPLFDRLGDLLRTGPTGTNVNDLVIGLASKP